MRHSRIQFNDRSHSPAIVNLRSSYQVKLSGGAGSSTSVETLTLASLIKQVTLRANKCHSLAALCFALFLTFEFCLWTECSTDDSFVWHVNKPHSLPVSCCVTSANQTLRSNAFFCEIFSTWRAQIVCLMSKPLGDWCDQSDATFALANHRIQWEFQVYAAFPWQQRVALVRKETCFCSVKSAASGTSCCCRRLRWRRAKDATFVYVAKLPQPTLFHVIESLIYFSTQYLTLWYMDTFIQFNQLFYLRSRFLNVIRNL